MFVNIDKVNYALQACGKNCHCVLHVSKKHAMCCRLNPVLLGTISSEDNHIPFDSRGQSDLNHEPVCPFLNKKQTLSNYYHTSTLLTSQIVVRC